MVYGHIGKPVPPDVAPWRADARRTGHVTDGEQMVSASAGGTGQRSGQRRVVATIGDVATAAGVSRATVSRVMNGRSTVDATIAERVRDAAASLSYRPSNAARSLALGRTQTVALVVPDLGNPVFQQILRGVMDGAAEDGYRVLVADTVEDDQQEGAIQDRKSVV